MYKELSGNYDVRNATFKEVVAISNVLYEAGEIPYKEHSILTFDFGRATDDLKRYALEYVSLNLTCMKLTAKEIGLPRLRRGHQVILTMEI